MKKLLLFAGLVMTIFSASSFIKKKNVKPRSIARDLAFPVAGERSHIGSFWGDRRSGGKRKHEGIDIFAKKGTDVVAVCDGSIVSVGNSGIGGKTVWLRADDYSWSAYYAHLDSQAVYAGQAIKKGTVIGTVGNTGNARYTPSHLHFGIYTFSGAVDPLPYVQTAPKILSPVDNDVDAMSDESKEIVQNRKTVPLLKAGQRWTSAFPERFVCKQLFITAADPGIQFFVTTRANVVKVKGNTYQVIGKFHQSRNGEHPYDIVLSDNQRLYISKDKKLLTGTGKQIGTVVWKS